MRARDFDQSESDRRESDLRSFHETAERARGVSLKQILAESSAASGAAAAASAAAAAPAPLPPAAPSGPIITLHVYDVTDFVDEHPGAQVLAEAAGLADATEYFDMAAHSDAALRRLETLAVPGCTALRYDRELEALRHRQPFLALAAGVCAVPPLLCALLRCASSTAPGFQSAVPAALSGLAVVGAAAFAIWASLHKGAHLK